MVSFCIVNWNGGEVLEKCVNSIISNTKNFEYEIVVVDNNSEDNSIELIQDKENVKIVKNQVNDFFSKGTNQSVDHSVGDVLVLMNNDIIFTENSISYYLQQLESNPEEIISPRLINIDGTQQVSIRNILTPKRLINEMFRFSKTPEKIWIRTDLDYNVRQYVEQPLYSLLFMNRETFFKTGYLDDRFPLLFNDVDWFKRAKDLGIRTLYVPGPKITHYHGYSVNKKKFKKILSSTNSMLKYFIKHYRGILFIILPFVVLSFLGRIIRDLRE